MLMYLRIDEIADLRAAIYSINEYMYNGKLYDRLSVKYFTHFVTM